MVVALLTFLVFLILPIAVIIFLVQIFSKRGKEETVEDIIDFERKTRSVYVYFLLICLLISMIGGGIFLFSSAVDLFLPEEPYPTYDGKIRDRNERDKNQAIVNMSTSIAILAASIPLFLHHSNIAKNEIIKKSKKDG